MARNPEDLVVYVLVGSPEQIKAGRGETALTIEQAAARLRLSISTTRRLVQSGRLPVVATFARTQLFRESDVERLRGGS